MLERCRFVFDVLFGHFIEIRDIILLRSVWDICLLGVRSDDNFRYDRVFRNDGLLVVFTKGLLNLFLTTRGKVVIFMIFIDWVVLGLPFLLCDLHGAISVHHVRRRIAVLELSRTGSILIRLLLLVLRVLIEVTTTSSKATTAATTASAIAAAIVVAILEITRGVVLLEVAILAHVLTIIGTKIIPHAIRKCICIIILPHIVVLAAPAIHPLGGIEIHSHAHSIHPVHVCTSVGTAKSAEHAHLVHVHHGHSCKRN